MKQQIREWIQFFFVVAFGLAVSGCATAPTIKTDYQPGVDFTRYRTFSLFPVQPDAPGVDLPTLQRISRPAYDAIVAGLKAKGLQPVATGTGDLVVSVRGGSLPRVAIAEQGYSEMVMTRRGGVVVHHGTTDYRAYDERALVIQLFDSRTKTLVWVGEGRRQTTEAITAERVVNGIRQILAEYPPAKRGNN